MEVELDADFVASGEESSGALVRKNSKSNSRRNLEEIEATETVKPETEMDRNAGIETEIEGVIIEERNDEKSSGEGFEGVNENTRLDTAEENVKHENKEFISTAYSLSMKTSDEPPVVTDMTVNSKEWIGSSVYYVDEQGLWKCRHCSWVYAAIKPGVDIIQKHKEHYEGMNNEKALFEQVFPIKHEFQMGSQINATLHRGIKTIDYESKETESVMSEMVNQTMTEMKNDQKWPPAEGILQSNYMVSETSTGAYVTQSSVTGKFNQIENIKNGKSAFLDTRVFSEIGSTATVRIGELASNEVQEKRENAGIKEHQHWNGASKIVLQKSQDGLVRPKDEKQLRENQIRILEKSALEGKVEDIANILKEQQSHDIVCPNCGSCITKRFILRKRKRTSQVSEDSNDVPAAVSEEEYEITEDQINRPEMPIEQDTVAYGCLACFSFIIGRGLKPFQTKSESGNNSLAEQYTSENDHESGMLVDKEKDSFYCFPFRYPWGHSKPRDRLKEPLLNKEDPDKEMAIALDESNSYGKSQPVKYSAGLQVPGDKLKEPLLNKEDPDKEMAMALDESNSYGKLQPVKYSTGLQVPDDQQRKVISPLKPDSIESSNSLETRDPATLAKSKVDDSVSQSSEISPDSANIVIPADGRVATVIDIVQTDDHQPSNAGTSVSELPKISKGEVQNLNVVTDWDLLKSIVYGGLTVSITSLGVVSSAAGGGAKTLTVIAISLANLVAGFFLIINNLWSLAHSGKLVETVGCRPWFNGFIAILSYLIFGSLAPITYGFSFQKSDDIVYKFLAASLVSLISIILLALGKARVTDKNYIGSVILYVVTGFCASIIGFFAGEYIKKLLEKWGFTTD